MYTSVYPDSSSVITNYILNLQIAIDIYKLFAFLSGFNAKYKNLAKRELHKKQILYIWPGSLIKRFFYIYHSNLSIS